MRRWLVALLRAPDVLAPRERAQAGDLLGSWAIPAPACGTVLARGKQAGQRRRSMPDLLWCRVPAGPFLMGSTEQDEDAYEDEKPQHTLHLPEFYVARYPITNAQYRPFVEGGGYDDADYWTVEGWAWRNGAEADLSAIDDEDSGKTMSVAGAAARGEAGSTLLVGGCAPGPAQPPGGGRDVVRGDGLLCLAGKTDRRAARRGGLGGLARRAGEPL